MYVKLFVFVFLLSFAVSTPIIPDDLTSALDLVYSYLWPYKEDDGKPAFLKGTDSRVGFGFAFGNHADFQVMFELGPQTNTRPLNGQKCQGSCKETRKVPSANPAKSKEREELLQSDASFYLQNWAREYKIHQPQSGKFPENVLENLKRLYKKQSEVAKKMGVRSEAEVKRIAEDLSNVN